MEVYLGTVDGTHSRRRLLRQRRVRQHAAGVQHTLQLRLCKAQKQPLHQRFIISVYVSRSWQRRIRRHLHVVPPAAPALQRMPNTIKSGNTGFGSGAFVFSSPARSTPSSSVLQLHTAGSKPLIAILLMDLGSQAAASTPPACSRPCSSGSMAHARCDQNCEHWRLQRRVCQHATCRQNALQPVSRANKRHKE